MEKHHEAWLSIHPEWSAKDLYDAISMGFDIHHEDGDHSNNDPSNLLLVEHQDHMRLHGSVPLNQKLERGKLAQKIEKGRSCYELREYGMYWWQVAMRVYNDRNKSTAASNAAKKYAEYHNMTWPVKPETKDNGGL